MKCVSLFEIIDFLLGYYDKNIMPLLSALNLVSIGMFTLDAEHYFQRGLLCLNIAFVEVGLRMTFDSHLVSIVVSEKG